MTYNTIINEAFTNTQYTALGTHNLLWGDHSGAMRIGTSGTKVGCAGESRSSVAVNFSGTYAQVELELLTFSAAGRGPMIHFTHASTGFWDWSGYWLYCTSTGITVYRGDNDSGGDSLGTRSVTLVAGDRVGLFSERNGVLKILVNDAQVGANISDSSYTAARPALMAESTLDDFADNYIAYDVEPSSPYDSGLSGPTHDTVLRELDPTYSSGDISGSTALGARGTATQRMIALLKFDFFNIPAGATVTAATLTLVTGEFSGGAIDVTAHRILSANPAFSDEGFGLAASSGESSWDYRVHNTVRWAGDTGANGGTDAGCSVSGTDYAATAMLGGTISGTHTTSNNLTELSVAEVESMIANNYGMVIVTPDNQYAYFYSGENATLARRPRLVITYTLPASGQLAHPDSDVSAGGWTPSTGGALYAMVDEVSANDADYIKSNTGAASDPTTLTLSDISPPAAGDVTVTLRHRTGA